MADKYVFFDELKDYGLLIGRRQLDRLEARGLFPKRIHLSPHKIAWITAEVEAHFKAMAKSREARQ